MEKVGGKVLESQRREEGWRSRKRQLCVGDDERILDKYLRVASHTDAAVRLRYHHLGHQTRILTHHASYLTRS